MTIKLVASDLDDTLVDRNSNIAASNLKAIEVINEKNINFAICTGKTYSITKNICDKCNASYGIFGNGMQIMDLKNKKEIYRNLLAKEDIKKCMEIAKQHKLHVHIYTDNAVVTEKLLYMDLRNYTLSQTPTGSKDLEFKIVDNIEEYILNNDINIFKIVISDETGLMDVKTEIEKATDLNIVYVKKIGEYKDYIIKKEYEYLDINPKNISKNEALNVLKGYLNINKDEVMAIGDNLNDIGMIKDSGIGVAVANAYDDVKKFATYTTTNNAADGGFAEAIEKYIV